MRAAQEARCYDPGMNKLFSGLLGGIALTALLTGCSTTAPAPEETEAAETTAAEASPTGTPTEPPIVFTLSDEAATAMCADAILDAYDPVALEMGADKQFDFTTAFKIEHQVGARVYYFENVSPEPGNPAHCKVFPDGTFTLAEI